MGRNQQATILTEQQIKLAEQLLLTVKNREPYVTYEELATRIAPPMHWRQVGREIGQISKVCRELGLPLLSAKVQGKYSKQPGEGFYHLCVELGLDVVGRTEKEVYAEERKRIRECKEWHKLADYLHLNLDLDLDGKPNAATQEKIGVTEKNFWVFPCNLKKYDIISAFDALSEIDWRQSVKCNVGDEVFLYCGIPYSQIVFHTVVTKIGIPFVETIPDEQFRIDTTSNGKDSRFGFARLKLIKSTYSGKLSLSRLLEHGLKTAPMGPIRVTGDLLNFINSGFRSKVLPDAHVEEITDTLQNYAEGSVKQVLVNAYERNPQARKKCIAIHGSKCMICGFDFAAFYGDDFEGLIHIHHIRSLHLEGEKHKVDPENDLIPVCPNCHLALHSKPGGVYSPDELKEIINMVAKSRGNSTYK